MRIPLAPAGRREILIITLVFGGLAIAGFAIAHAGHSWAWPIGGVFTLLWLGGIAFFRDPERRVPNEPGALVAPADGKVVEITDLDHHDDVGGSATRIAIFLSVFDVHINRSPCTGTVKAVRYKPGKFLDARDPNSGLLNEANDIIIEPDAPGVGPMVVRQIAGLIARRIVCSVKVGDRVEIGQRVGLIKFGSRTELIVPNPGHYTPAVRIGDRSSAATTILARPTPPSSAPSEN